MLSLMSFDHNKVTHVITSNITMVCFYLAHDNPCNYFGAWSHILFVIIIVEIVLHKITNDELYSNCISSRKGYR